MWSISANSGDVMALRVTCWDCDLMQHNVIICINVALIGWMATCPLTNDTRHSLTWRNASTNASSRLWVHFIIFQRTQDCLRSRFLFLSCQESTCYTHLNLMHQENCRFPELLPLSLKHRLLEDASIQVLFSLTWKALAELCRTCQNGALSRGILIRVLWKFWAIVSLVSMAAAHIAIFMHC